MATTNNLETLLTEHDIARITGLSLASVRRWRLSGQGPRYLKLGRAVRYQRVDLAAWLQSRPTGGEAPESLEACDPPRPPAQGRQLSPN